MLSNCAAGEDSWESLGQQGDQISQSYRKSTLNMHWKDWFWSWSSNTLATWCKELTHWKTPWCCERLRAEGGVRAWDGWMASPTQWTWTWANSRRQRRTGKPGVLQSMGFLQLKFLTVTVQAFYLITYLFILQFESLVIYDIVLCCWIRLFVTPWIAAFQASLSSTVSWSLLKFMSVESVMLSNHLILMTLFHHRLL